MYNSLNLYKSECYFHLFTFKMESFLQYIVLSFFDVHMLPLHIFFFLKQMIGIIKTIGIQKKNNLHVYIILLNLLKPCSCNCTAGKS